MAVARPLTQLRLLPPDGRPAERRMLRALIVSIPLSALAWTAIMLPIAAVFMN